MKEKLRFLVEELKNDSCEYKDLEVPDDFDEAFSLYRALSNIRQVDGSRFSDKFYAYEKEVLKYITNNKKVVDLKNLKPTKKDKKIYIWQGDITTLRVDAIVNAANSEMLGCFIPSHSCIDNIIHTMAGVELREECYRIMENKRRVFGRDYVLETGNAEITDAFNLPSNYVIHTVGPIVRGGLTNQHRDNLKKSYLSVLKLCEENSIRSIAFCCISTGVFMFPNDEAAKIAVKTVTEYLDKVESCVEKVVFNVFKDVDLRIYENLLER